MSEAKQTGPLQNLFVDVKRILEFIEFKDQVSADAAETDESKALAELWMNAMIEDDSYITYKNWWNKSMFQEVTPNIKTVEYNYYLEHPFNVPLKYRDVLLVKGREAFVSKYEEQNDYYRMLNGLPPTSTSSQDYVYLSTSLRNQFHVDNLPIHELSTYVQNAYMNTDEYKAVLEEYPDRKYLRYLGRYKIGVYRARKARDFDIIRYPSNRADINPNLLNIFASMYSDYREYVITVLYNRQLESLYQNYREFMGMLIVAFTTLQIGNVGVEATNNRRYLDDTVLHTILSLYDIPDIPMMTKEVRRDLAIHVPELIKEKGTNDVYYDLIQILGYQDVAVSKLMLMKGQQFSDDGNSSTEINPYFIQIDLKDKNPYKTITSGKAPIYSYDEVTEGDPMWWNLQDVQDIIQNRPYTISDSKYIVIDAVVHQMRYIFEAIYFTRMILDNKYFTDQYLIEVPEIFGSEMVSIFDIILFVICVTCKTNNLDSTIFMDEDPLYATSGFNFDLDMDTFMEYVNGTEYVDKDRLMKYLDNLTMESSADVSRIFNDVMYPLREWLEGKISNSVIKDEYLEYENIYRALFTYDLARNKFLDDFEHTDEIVRKKYNISAEDMTAFKHFYPRTINGAAVTVKIDETTGEYKRSSSGQFIPDDDRYHSPFPIAGHEADWCIEVEAPSGEGKVPRGILYFHDILDHPDLRYVLNDEGKYIFIDWDEEHPENPPEFNTGAMQDAINKIAALDSTRLKNAVFQTYTAVMDGSGSYYYEGQKLPESIQMLYKDILLDKITLDLDGQNAIPSTYYEALRRKNPSLYSLLQEDDQEVLLNKTMTIVLEAEAELSVHMKYFEQSIIGEQLFFLPLISMIKRFKSILVDIARTGLKYVFDDKMDAGGNSNMFKIFDSVGFLIHFSTISGSGYEAQFGLYDTERGIKYNILARDRSEVLKMVYGEGFAAEERTTTMGSVRMVDEAIFYKNGKPIDPVDHYSMWYNGEPGVGRWSEEDDILFRTRTATENVQYPIDLEGWKDYVQSYIPHE